jgi:signal transduction histidine kinase
MMDEPSDTLLPENFRSRLMLERQAQYEDAKNHVISRLVIINLLILVGGGFLSYYLALRSLKPIEDAHEALGRFTADASHELRTPITAMRSENEVSLMNPNLTLGEAKRQIKSNIEELEKLTQLSEGLLRLASIGQSELIKKPIKAIDIVDAAIERVSHASKSKKITFVKDIPDNTTLTADEASLVEALIILLDNAVKYSSDKSTISVTARSKQRSNVISVKDTGVGIKASELPHIFDRFYRADSSRTKQKISGYGIGLAIAKNIVELHSGSIHVQSKPEKGSTFSISIPK